MDELYIRADKVETRWASAENSLGEKGMGAMLGQGRKGRPCIGIESGGTAVLAEAKGSGVIHRIWMTFSGYRDPALLKGAKIECFWDGNEKPAVCVPLGDFFLHSSGKLIAMESEFFASPQGKSLVCYIPMPFKTEMKISITNESEKTLNDLFYEVDYTLGDTFHNKCLYFHAFYNRMHATKMTEDYEILPTVQGAGRYIGSAISIIQNDGMPGWWGEGEVKGFIDGDVEHPTLCGTGSEDYIGTGWELGFFTHRFQGCTWCSDGHFCFYRFHVPDPLFFHSSIKMTIQQLGYADPPLRDTFKKLGLTIYKAGGKELFDLENGTPGLYERVGDDYSSVAYFYLDRPTNEFAPIESASERLEGYEF